MQKIHIYKSTADVDVATKFYNDMTFVEPEFWGKQIRNAVLAKKQPRKVFVQANTSLDESTGKVTLKHYEASYNGLIQSWADRKL